MNQIEKLNYLEYEKLNEKNYKDVLSIKHKLFKESHSDIDYEDYFNDLKHCDYFLVKHNGMPCAITGWYAFDNSKENAFMGWFGVMPDFRHRGFGKHILEYTIKEVKKQGYKYFRVYTDKIMNADSCKLYDKTMDLKEDYLADDKLGRLKIFVIYTKAFKRPIEPWNNRLLNEDDNYDCY